MGASHRILPLSGAVIISPPRGVMDILKRLWIERNALLKKVK
jgi:hypothetical protein